MEEVKINLGERSYPILIGPGLLAETGRIFREAGLRGKVLIVTNPTVAGLHLEPVLASLSAAGLTVEVVRVPDGEMYKNLDEANRLYDFLITGKYDRQAILVALGGGVIGDLTGFVAATYLRGVRFVQVPTTLLAQVDSSIGGKVAVNHPRGKNLIGAFYQPALVITDVATLATLPGPELSSGMAEVIKHGIILDENYFQFVCGEIQTIRKCDPGVMTAVVNGSCQIKGDIVENDEREAGLRAVLNFGHTIGHAVETVTNYTRFKHGEAVGLGMLGATLIGEEIGWLTGPELRLQLGQIMTDLGLPVHLDGLSVADLCEALTIDKKVADGRIRWVIPRRRGEVGLCSDVPLPVVAAVLEKMGGAR